MGEQSYSLSPFFLRENEAPRQRRPNDPAIKKQPKALSSLANLIYLSASSVMIAYAIDKNTNDENNPSELILSFMCLSLIYK
jgi:hypothetical protein